MEKIIEWKEKAIRVAKRSGPLNGWIVFQTAVSFEFFDEHRELFDDGNDRIDINTPLEVVERYIERICDGN